MQTLYGCKHYKYNDNLNNTCLKFNKRCILLDNPNCYDYNNKVDLGFWDNKGNYKEEIVEW